MYTTTLMEYIFSEIGDAWVWTVAVSSFIIVRDSDSMFAWSSLA